MLYQSGSRQAAKDRAAVSEYKLDQIPAKQIPYHNENSIFAFTKPHTSLDQQSKPAIKGLDKAEYETLFHAHYAHLCAYAFQFVDDGDAAEEVVQEVFFKLWIKRDEIQFESSIKAYLFRSVRNTSLNLLSHLKVRDQYKQINEQDRQLQEQSAGDVLNLRELDQKIRNCIEQLPEQRRKIFIMSRYDGLKYKEIAEQLELSQKTIENQMGKALQFLRTELAEYLPLILLFFHHLFRDG